MLSEYKLMMVGGLSTKKLSFGQRGPLNRAVL